jgi:hypothetical protein
MQDFVSKPEFIAQIPPSLVIKRVVGCTFTDWELYPPRFVLVTSMFVPWMVLS